jgi:hypothetical protein
VALPDGKQGECKSTASATNIPTNTTTTTTTNNVFPKDHQDEEATNNGVGKVGYSHHDDNHNDAHSISNNLSQEVTRRRVVGSGEKAFSPTEGRTHKTQEG